MNMFEARTPAEGQEALNDDLNRVCIETLGNRDNPRPEQMAAVFTRCGWRYFSKPHYLAFLAIALNLKTYAEADTFRRETIDYINGLWNELFGDLGVEPRQMITAERIAIATLSGMAVETMHTSELSDFSHELDALDTTLVRLLTPADAEGA